MSMLTRLRRLWLDVHLWIGVGLLIPFVIIGVTGSLLVWHEPMERWLEPHRYEVSEGAPLPLATHIENAQRAVGADFVVTAVRPPEEAGDPVTVQARKTGRPPEGQRPETRTAWIDPATGRVLDIANTRASAFGIMHVLHGSLMIPENGRKIVGWIGWAMLVSSLTGLWLWWPRNSALLKGLRWRRGPRTTFNLHHQIGFWLVIPLAILSATGVYISFPQSSRAFLGVFVELPAAERGGGRGGGGGPGGGGAPIDDARLTADQAAAAAQAALPGAQLIVVTLPTPGRDGADPEWRVQLRSEGAEANTTVSVNDVSGEARAQGARGGPSTDQNVARLMRRIHDGVDMPLIWQVAIFLGGWAPAFLGLTGVIMWLRHANSYPHPKFR